MGMLTRGEGRFRTFILWPEFLASSGPFLPMRTPNQDSNSAPKSHEFPAPKFTSERRPPPPPRLFRFKFAKHLESALRIECSEKHMLLGMHLCRTILPREDLKSKTITMAMRHNAPRFSPKI